MRNKVAKHLRRVAEQETVGKDKTITRTKYKELKKKYKAGKRNNEQEFLWLEEAGRIKASLCSDKIIDVKLGCQ